MYCRPTLTINYVLVYRYRLYRGVRRIFGGGVPRGGGGVPRSAKEANNPILLKVQSLQLSFRPAGVSLGGGGGAKAPPGPPLRRPCYKSIDLRFYNFELIDLGLIYMMMVAITA